MNNTAHDLPERLMTAAGIVQHQEWLREQLKDLEARYRSERGALEAALTEMDRRMDQYLSGLDLRRATLAEALLAIEGQCSSESRIHTVHLAIRDLASGAPHLRRGYYGVKQYAHFGDQEIHGDYGMGPKHGQIVFSVGLKPEARGRDLTAEETDACLYYLGNLVWE